MMEQEYKLRKDVDKLQIGVAQVESDINVLRAITVNGEDYYTKEEVDEELARLRAKSEGLPYFYKDSNSNLIVDLPINCPYSFRVDENYDLIVSLPEGETNHFVLDDSGNLGYNVNV